MTNLIFIALITGAVVILSVQSAGGVTVFFLGWRFDLSISMIVISAVLAGMILIQLLRGLVVNGRKRREAS